MASPSDAGGPRHVGRVVDPLVREDGGSTPDLQLRPGPESRPEGAGTGGFEEGGGSEEAVEIKDESSFTEGEGHPVRERLLAKARAARGASQPLVGPSTTDPAGGLDLRGGALEEISPPAAPRAPAAPRGAARPRLSPGVLAVFGTFVGLATVAALIAILIQLDPRSPPAPAEPSSSARAQPRAPDFGPPRPKKRERKKLAGPWRIDDAKGEPATKILHGKIGRDPFLKVVQAAGLPKGEAYRVYTALKGLKNLDRCARTDSFSALLERKSSRVRAFEYIVSREEVYQAKEQPNGLLEARKLDLKIRRERYSAGFMLDGEGFAEAAHRAGFEDGITTVVTKALDGFTSVAMFRRGDRIRLVAQEVTVLGEFSRYAGIEAVEYLPVDSGERPLRVYYYRSDKTRGYFDAKGRSLNEGGWRKPIKGAPITSRFNPRRMHPLLKKIMPHTGTDFGAPAGTPIRASSYGRISFLGYAGPSGNLVKIEHPGGIETGYAHCSKFAEGLQVGERVKRLQLIAYVGSTGRSTGPHLHFSAKKNGKFINPESLHLDGMKVLPGSERQAFFAHRAKYDEILDAIELPKPLEIPAEAGPAPPEQVTEEPSEATAPAAAEPSGRTDSPKPAAPGGGSAVYLTDEELLKSQGLDDVGEVDE